MRPWRSRAGQIVIPAMLIFPTLMLFVYLIFETAKLSREKIRHQFALDAAAFVEATNYSDFLNRTAYVNGAFPMRIFEQAYAGVNGNGVVNSGDVLWADCEGKVDGCTQVSYADILYNNGIFPRSQSGKHIYSDEDSWDIAYGGLGAGRNSTTPDIQDVVSLFSIADANKYWHHWNLATEIYKLWVQVFGLLGSVEDAQWQVLKRLTKDSNHSFLQKSYWLNTGDPANYGQELARAFDSALGDFKGEAHCAKKLVYHGNKELAGNGIQPSRIMGTDPPLQAGRDFPDSPGCSGGGIFQLETVDASYLRAFSQPNGGQFPGLSISLAWAYPRDNYFNVDFGRVGGTAPTIHTTVSIGVVPQGGPKPSVWPNPTPKFQVREFP